MKWFKHMSDAHMDEKLSEIIDEFGYEGYGRWWVILELIAKQMDKTDKCFVEYSWVKWQTFLKGKRNKLETFLERLENVSLLNLERSENKLKIICPKLLKLRDNYSKDLEVEKNNSPPKLPSKEVEVEVEVDNKNTSEKKFSDAHVQLAEDLAKPIREKFPSQKINIERWADDVRKLIDIDKHKPEQIAWLWNWIRNHRQGNFSWNDNCRTPGKLRERKDGLTYFEIIKNQALQESRAASGQEPSELDIRREAMCLQGYDRVCDDVQEKPLEEYFEQARENLLNGTA